MTGAATMTSRKPMLWVYPEYGGQIAVRIGDKKVIRRGLNQKKPGDWEVYDIVKDRAEKNNLAKEDAVLIRQAQEILSREVSENSVFPMKLP
jgi:hypothetical protein